MVRKNWRRRKIENASPNQFGRITGQSVPMKLNPNGWNFAHITYSGTTVTCGGSISATSTTMNIACRPRHRSRASAYATGTLETTTPSVASTEYSSVFSVHFQSGAFVQTSTKLRQRNGCGQRSGDSAWPFVISDVSAMNRNGARNAIAKPIRTAWFATATRKRRRGAGAGGGGGGGGGGA